MGGSVRVARLGYSEDCPVSSEPMSIATEGQVEGALEGGREEAFSEVVIVTGACLDGGREWLIRIL